MNSMKSQSRRAFISIVIESTRIPQSFWALERQAIDTLIIIHCRLKKRNRPAQKPDRDNHSKQKLHR